jgi:plasmid stability protein
VAQFIVRNVEDSVKQQLKRRAARHGRSMEEEIRHILRCAVKEKERAATKLGSRIAGRFERIGLASDIPEQRGQTVRSADFRR